MQLCGTFQNFLMRCAWCQKQSFSLYSKKCRKVRSYNGRKACLMRLSIMRLECAQALWIAKVRQNFWHNNNPFWRNCTQEVREKDKDFLEWRSLIPGSQNLHKETRNTMLSHQQDIHLFQKLMLVMIGPLAQTGLVWNMEAQIGRSRIKTQRESIFSSLLCLSFKKFIYSHCLKILPFSTLKCTNTSSNCLEFLKPESWLSNKLNFFKKDSSKTEKYNSVMKLQSRLF